MAPVYHKWGFKCAKHQQIFYEGHIKCPEGYKPPHEVVVKPISDDLMDDIIAYEHSVSRLDRSGIMKRMKQSGDTLSLKYAILNGKIAGFVVLDKDYSGKHIISSFQADSSHIARALLFDVVKNDLVEDSLVIVSLPGMNRESCVQLYAEFGIDKELACYQAMYSEFDMEADWGRVYASFSYDIGFV